MSLLSSILLYYCILFILGTVFWSFSTVLIERWRSGKSGIILGRSECPQCHRILSARQLFPLLSYILQWGKCHSCRTKISLFYPIAEGIMWLIFCIMGYVNMSLWNAPISLQILLLLILWFITWIYVLYDAKYMEIPDQIMIPWILWYISLIILWFFYLPIQGIFFDRETYQNYSSFVIDHIRASILIYSFFYIQILIPGGIYLLKHKRNKDFIELLTSYFLFPLELLFGWIWRKKTVKEEIDDPMPAWIWWGDLRVALFIGITLWSIHTISTLFFSYILWSIIGVSMMLYSQEKKSQIAFWPFLWIWWILSVFLYSEILNILL